MAETNPNGANQYQFDPRQKLCWDYYIDPKSETFGNALRSALKAGYSEEYADDITMTGWFKDNLWRINAKVKAEKKFEQLMNLDLNNGGDRVDVGIARIQADIAKHLTKTLGRDDYAERQEHTGKDGKELPVPIMVIERDVQGDDSNTED